MFVSNKIAASAQKMRGGYYTPQLLANYLCEWAVRGYSERILEPSCGDGSFIEALSGRIKHIGAQGSSVTAVELIDDELRIAKSKGKHLNATWIKGDFFDVFERLQTGEKFDVVVGNPPFIRFQHFDADSRDKAFSALKKFGYKPTKLANCWSAFVQLSIELLADGGRLAMVLPAELLQVDYARELREKLACSFKDMTLIGFREIVFPDIQQEIVLVLADGKLTKADADTRSALHTLEFKDGNELLQAAHLDEKIAHCPTKLVRSHVKWTSLFIDKDLYDAFFKVSDNLGCAVLGEFADVDVGVVTGRNSFFVLSDDQQKALRAKKHCVPVVGRTNALQSIMFDRADYRSYSKSNACWLLTLKDVGEEEFSSELIDYIALGKEAGVSDGYKCRIRRRWFDVPSVYVPDAFMFRQIHEAPLIVANEAKATSTDTIHRVRFKRRVDKKLFCASAVNSLTFAWAEVCGRSYGGGVLELEPREAERLPIAYSESYEVDVDYVDRCLRSKDTIRALDHVDDVILKKGLGLSDADVASARNVWISLRDRRFGRR